MASSSSTGEEPPTSSTVANSPPLVSTEAQMFVATGHANCQQLKDMLIKEDSSSRLTSTPDPPSPPPVMDPGLLAVCCSGSWKKLRSFLNEEPRPSSSDGITGGSAVQQPPRDHEALLRVSFLDRVTVDGDTFLHVMATNSVGEDLIEDGLGLIIRQKAVQFLSRQNNSGDTALHCAARADKPGMVSFLVDLAIANDVDTVKALLEKENNRRWTVLHEAVHVGCNEMVDLLMTEDPELAKFPEDATSPLYLAILLENEAIARTLHEKSGGVLSYSGPNGQNALHAAVFRGIGLTMMLSGWNDALTVQQDGNGSTPLHMAASMLKQRDGRTVRLFILNANTDALYQPDHEGSFPIHVAASVDAYITVRDYIQNSPNCAGLRDARGRTFLHVAVEKMKTRTVSSACINQSLSWILDMQDNDGNTALHLAVQAGGLTMFCALVGNRKVQLNLSNDKGETPRDIARWNLPKRGLYYNQNSEAKVILALKMAKAHWGIYRQDYFEKYDIMQAKQDAIHEMGILRDSTQNLCIGSVLIATVTFGATFALPGGYIADDRANGGTPTLAGRYTFRAFIVANALSFAFSTIATIGLMSAGSPLYNIRSRERHLLVAFYFMKISVTTLVAAFALATYTMLTSVAKITAVAVCVVSSVVSLYSNFEVATKHSMVLLALRRRAGMPNNKIVTFPLYAFYFVRTLLYNLWPILFVFGLAALRHTGHKVEPAAAPPLA